MLNGITTVQASPDQRRDKLWQQQFNNSTIADYKKIFYPFTFSISQLSFISSFNVRTISSNPSYQSRCGLIAEQPPSSLSTHCVNFHTLPQPGQRAPVAKVFQIVPQVHCQCAPPSGSHLHLGQQMCILSISVYRCKMKQPFKVSANGCLRPAFMIKLSAA